MWHCSASPRRVSGARGAPLPARGTGSCGRSPQHTRCCRNGGGCHSAPFMALLEMWEREPGGERKAEPEPWAVSPVQSGQHQGVRAKCAVHPSPPPASTRHWGPGQVHAQLWDSAASSADGFWTSCFPPRLDGTRKPFQSTSSAALQEKPWRRHPRCAKHPAPSHAREAGKWTTGTRSSWPRAIRMTCSGRGLLFSQGN